MSDQTIFETHLAAALGRYADLAPALDAEAIASTAIQGDRGRAIRRRLVHLRAMTIGSSPSRGLRVAYLVALVALLVAGLILAAVAGGVFQQESPLDIGGNGEIVFSYIGTGHEAIADVAVDADGGTGRPIEAGRCPTFSNDGSVLAWLSYEGTAAALVTAAPGGSVAATTVLVDPVERSVPFALSPDGTRVAWLKPAKSHAAGASQPVATSPTTEPDSDLWVATLDAGPGALIVPASTAPGASFDSPLWSPDGRRLAFAVYVRNSATGESERVGIDVVDADGSNRQRLTDRRGLLDDGMAWSPDSHSIVFAALSDGSGAPAAAGAALGALQRDLFSVRVDGSGDLQITDTPATEHDPAWSPDGAFLAFETSTEEAGDRVSTVRMNGAVPEGRLLLGPESAWFVWAPDGRQLLWQELTTVRPETFRTTLHSVDPAFQSPSTTLQVVEGLVACVPSWQRRTP